MPAENPSIVLPNTPNAVKRTVDCTFIHDGLSVHIRIPNAVDPETSPGLEMLKAKQLLSSIARALIEANGV